ncbi:MAG: hypothetical protein WC120_05375 [Parcubacteria group bacterium]|jgi:hypothetical protein
MPGYAIGGPDQGGTGKSWPDFLTLTVKAGEAITAGQAVGFYKTATTLDDNIVYIVGAATEFVAGVALDTAASGAMLRIQVWGPNQVAMTNAGTSTKIQYMVPGAAGIFTSTAGAHATYVPTMFGQVMVASGSAAQPVNTVFLNCSHGPARAIAGVDQGGTGSSFPAPVYRMVAAGVATIVAGDPLTHYLSGATAATSDANKVYRAAAVTQHVCGVAMESATAVGQMIKMQVFGPNQVAMTLKSASTSSETNALTTGDSAGVFIATASTHADAHNCAFGHVITASTLTAQPVNTVFLTCPFGSGAVAGQDQGGTGLTQQEIETIEVIAGGAITAGNLVTCYKSDLTADTFDSLKVYATGVVTEQVRGVALETAASGAPLKIQTYGPNQVAIVIGTGDSTVGHDLIPHATAGAATSCAVTATQASAFAHVLVASSGSSNAVNTVFLYCGKG